MPEQKGKLKEQFDYKGHRCAIVEMQMPATGNFHNGYVRVADSADQVDSSHYEDLENLYIPDYDSPDYAYNSFVSKLETAELTFSGNNKVLPDGFWFGFDSAHAWSDRKPESKTHQSVKERLKDLVHEMIEKNVFERVKQNE